MVVNHCGVGCGGWDHRIMRGRMPEHSVEYVLCASHWQITNRVNCAAVGRESERENFSRSGECHSPCPFWAFDPVIGNLLPRASSCCLAVTLKVPCCTTYLKIRIICFKLKQASSSSTRPSKPKCISTWRKSWLYCLLWQRFACDMAYPWKTFSRKFWLCGIFILISLCDGLLLYLK